MLYCNRAHASISDVQATLRLLYTRPGLPFKELGVLPTKCVHTYMFRAVINSEFALHGINISANVMQARREGRPEPSRVTQISVSLFILDRLVFRTQRVHVEPLQNYCI